MIITAILARGSNNGIGIDNDLPWHLPTDMAFFKRKTLNRHVLMGRKSFEGIKVPLPKRVNIVVSRNTHFVVDGALMARSIEEGIKIAKDAGETELMIMGGAEIYKQSLPYLTRLLLTDVDFAPKADAFFTEPDWSDFEEVWREEHLADEKHKYNFTFRQLERVRNFTEIDL